MRFTLNVNALRVKLPTLRFTRDDATWKEEKHKRDKDGKFSSTGGGVSSSGEGLNKLAFTALAASNGMDTSAGHKALHKKLFPGSGWKEHHDKLVASGFTPKEFAKAPGSGFHASSQTYTHPSGAQAKLDYHEQFGKGAAGKHVALKLISPGASGFMKPDPEQAASTMKSLGADIPDLPTPKPKPTPQVSNPSPPPPSQQEWADPKHETQTTTEPGGASAAKPSEPSAPLPNKVQKKLKAGEVDMHAVAAEIRPNLDDYTVDSVKNYFAKRLEMLDAAAKSPNPVEALKAVDINKHRTKLIAYRAALVAAHEQSSGGPAIPSGVPSGAKPIPSTDMHPGTVVPKGTQKAKLYTGGTAAGGKSVTAVLDIDKETCPEKWRDGPPPKMTEHDWYAWHEEQKKQLTTAERQAQAAYQGSSYRSMNKLLAGKYDGPAEVKAQLEQYNKDMQSACLKGRVAQTVAVRRGIEGSLQNVIDFDHPENAVGGVFLHKGFVSTSRDTGFHRSTMMHLTIPAGSQGHTMKELGSEKEIVLPHSSMFRIDKISKTGGGHIVHCTYLGVRKEE